MAAMNPVELRIIIDAQNKASATLRKAQKDIDNLSKSTKALGASEMAMAGIHGGLGRVGLAASAATTRMTALGDKISGFAGRHMGVLMVAGAIGATAKSGALLEARLSSLGGKVGETKKRIQDLSDASKGAFSMPEIVDAENKIKAFDIGMELTPKMLMNIQGRAAQMGITTTKALDDIILGLARNSRKILDNVGLIVSQSEANKRYAKQVGKTVHQLNDAERRTAFLNLAMSELEKTTITSTTAYGESLKAAAHMKDAFAQIQLALAPLMIAVEPLTDIFLSLAKIFGAVLGPVVMVLSHMFAELLGVFDKLLKGVTWIIKTALIPLEAILGSIGNAYNTVVNSGLVPYKKATDAAADSTEKLAETADTAAKAISNMQEVIRVNGALEKVHIDLKEKHHAAVIKLADAELKSLELTKSANKGLTESEKMRRQRLKIMKAEAERRQQILRIEKKRIAGLAELDKQFDKNEIGARRLAKAQRVLNFASAEQVKSANRSASALKRLARQEAIGLRDKKKQTSATKSRTRALLDWLEAVRKTNAFIRDAHLATAERVFSIRDETAAIGDRVDILKLEKNMRAAGDPVAKAKIEHQIRMNELQQDFNDKIKDMDPVVRLAAHDELTQMFDLLKGEELERFKKQLDDIDGLRAAHSIQQMTDALRESSSVMQSMSPQMAIATSAIGSVAGIWRTFAADTQKSGGKIAGAIGQTFGTIGPAAASFIEDQKNQAKVMAAFEVAMGIAAAVTPGQGPWVAAAHFAAAAMFGAIAHTGIGTKSSKAKGGAGAAGLPGGGMVPPPQDGPKQIVINFTDGMVLGDAQSLAKKINQTIDQTSGTGTPSAA